MTGRIRSFDWASTPLGAIETWPDRLKVVVEMMLGHGFPMIVLWGPELVQIYNEGYRELMGSKHPGGLGQPTRECWPEVWHINEPIYRKVWTGETLTFEDGLYPLIRSGRQEDAWLTITYGPLRDGGNTIGGVLVTMFETTQRVLAERALRASEARLARELDSTMRLQKTGSLLVGVDDGQALFDEILDTAMAITRADFGTMQLYDAEQSELHLIASKNLHAKSREDWQIVSIQNGTSCGSALQHGERVVIPDAKHSSSVGPETIRNFALCGIAAVQSTPLTTREGRLIGMISTHWREPHCPEEDELQLFDVLARQAADFFERQRVTAALRDSEERQAFVLELSDKLRPLADPVDIQTAAVRLLGRHLRANRVAFAEDCGDGQTVVLTRNYTDGVPGIEGKYRYADFGPDLLREMQAGRALVRPDVANQPGLSRAERDAHAALQLAATLNMPLVKAGRLVAILAVHYAAPHAFTDSELSLVHEVGQRLWAEIERARTEAALRSSEARFRQFAEAASGALWIRDADTLAMEYISPAVARIYGAAPYAFLGDVKVWAATIVPEDRAAALAQIEKARLGQAGVNEFRVQRPTDNAFVWIRNTVFPLHDERGRVQRIGGIFEDVTDHKLGIEHQAVLLAELQHRVRNIMALVRSIAARTGQHAETVSEFAERLNGRLMAFARVQVLLTRAANAGAGVGAIVRDEVGAQALDASRYDIAGDEVQLAPKAAELLTLAVHELASNAVKHGTFSPRGGSVAIRWSTFQEGGRDWLRFLWDEECVAPPTSKKGRGFGRELIEGRVPYELGGRGTLVIGETGAKCRLEFPLRDGASILETDAPLPAKVFGGALDMTGAADLSGHRILVVEDDYYLASDTSRALEGAGAAVVGPCASEEAALTEVAAARPSAAVLDLNLGTGASFALAATLQSSGVPLVFVTGYDQDIIPASFADVTRLQKPVELRQIVAAVAKAMGITA